MADQSVRWVGDFLLQFGEAPLPPAARDGARWEIEHEEPGSILYFSAPSSHWRGSPLSHWHDWELEYWLIGELWGKRTNKNPADWPGHFVLLAVDSHKKQWHFWTNRCGTFHAYYAITTKCTAISTYSPASACMTDKHLDLEAISGFFTFGFFPQDRTYWHDLKIIKPATHLVFDTTGNLISQSRTWQWFHHPQDATSLDDSVDEFASLFHSILDDQIQNRKLVFPISGGLDSRSTIAAIPSYVSSDHILTYSYGYSPDSIETCIAEKIAAARSLPFRKFTIQPYLFDKLDQVIDCVEGFQDITQSRQAFVTDWTAAHSDFVMAAHWGDLWMGDMGLAGKSHAISPDKLVDYAYAKFSKPSTWLMDEISLRNDPKFKPIEYLHEVLKSELNALSQLSDMDFRFKALKTELWTFRWTSASLRMFQPGGFPLIPFIDPRLVDFFCTIPTDYVARRKLQIEYLKRYAPDLARITWQPYDSNLYWYKHFNNLLIPKRAVKKAIRALRQKPVIQRNWEVQFLSPGMCEKLDNHFGTDGLKIFEIVPQGDIQTLLRHFYTAQTPTNGYTVSMLLTFSAWLERYG